MNMPDDNAEMVLSDAKENMQKSLSGLTHDLAKIRTGRANPALLEGLMVDYYGTPTPIQSLASFTSQEARIILVSPYDVGAIGNIERAIRDSDLGVNPANDGKLLRCVFPELTEERRKEYIKVARHKAEEGRVAVRNLRRHAKQELERMEKDGEVGQDDVTGAEKRLDGMTKKHTDAIDDLLKHKESELLEV
jgi:ribosome recycling factor